MTELLSLMFLTSYTYLDLNKSAFFLKKKSPGLGQHGHGLYCGVNANSGLQMQEV